MLTATHYDLTKEYCVRTPGPYITFVYNVNDIFNNQDNIKNWTKYNTLYMESCRHCVYHDFCKMYKYKKEYGYLTTYLCKYCYSKIKTQYNIKLYKV
jgi:hypothetical protein